MALFKSKTVAEPVVVEAPDAQQTPYAGSINGDAVVTAPHVLISGPTGTGKTLRALVPGALLWRGPRVLVSSKTDYLKKVVEKGIASRGPVYVLDLAGELDPSFDWLQGVDYQMVTSVPTALIENDDDALAMASLLMTVGSMGAGQGSSDSSAFWQTLTTESMAALLLAGRESGEGIDWSLRAAGRITGEGVDDDGPSWVSAVELVKDISRHGEDLAAKATLDPKMADSIKATMQTGLAPWLLSNVAGRGRDTVPFSPKMLESDGEPTLAVVAPADGVAAGAAVAVVETIIRHWRRGIERGLRRVLLSIDEAVNTCFARETEVLTREGVREIGDLAGSTATVLDGDGNWVEATARHYGVQPLRRIVLTRDGDTKEIHATGEHGWFVVGDGGEYRSTTDELEPGNQLASVGDVKRWTVVAVEQTDRVESVYCFEVPTTGSFALAGRIVTSNCPIPKLPVYVTEARGLGVACVIAVQSTKQMVLKWGKEGADVLREVFPAALILYGAPEREMLENAAWWDGEHDRQTESIDHQGHKSISSERTARTVATDLLPQSVEEGRLLLYGRKGKLVDLPGIWQFA